jgi:hypothetical protein
MNALKATGIGFTAALIAGCAGTGTSGFTYDAQYKTNVPKNTEECYDASVLLGANAERTKDIVKKVLVAVDATIDQETAQTVSAQRNRHIGVFVGNGGEELVVNWKAIDPEKTFVTVATKTGFVGAAGQKAWSCQVVNEMVKMVAK